MKYLKLEFIDAGFFTNPNSKDYVSDLDGSRKRQNNNQKVSISENQISNMLHVLLGERPSATYRNTIFKPIGYIKNFADQSFIKIKTIRHFTKEGKGYYGSELIQTRKSAWDSTPKTPTLIYWIRIEDLLTNYGDNSLYVELIDIMERKLNKKVINTPAKEIILEFNSKFPNDLELNNYKNKLLKKQKSPLVEFLNENFKDISFSKNRRTRITNNIGIEYITRVSGSLIIPISDEAIIKLKQSKGCATLLDGGVVFIEDLCDEEDLTMSELNEYINIKDLEKYESNN